MQRIERLALKQRQRAERARRLQSTDDGGLLVADCVAVYRQRPAVVRSMLLRRKYVEHTSPAFTGQSHSRPDVKKKHKRVEDEPI